MTAKRRKDPHVVFDVAGRRLAVEARSVIEMVCLPPLSPVPEAGAHVRGVADLRGRVLPVLDLRILLGLESARAEATRLVETLRAREEDHRRWVDELVAAVRERREFTLATDPARCAFGRWYDSFRSGNTAVMFLVRSFDAPHREVHALADRALRLAGEGRGKEAVDLVEGARHTTLAALLSAFHALYEELLGNGREMGIVLAAGGRLAVLAVDAVLTVEPLREGGAEDFSSALAGLAENRHFRGFGRMRGDGSLVLEVDPESLLRHAPPLPAP